MISAANNWLHGSVTSRMDYLTQLSSDPTHTARFDRRMFRVYVSLMIALMIAAAAIWVLRAKVFAS